MDRGEWKEDKEISSGSVLRDFQDNDHYTKSRHQYDDVYETFHVYNARCMQVQGVDTKKDLCNLL